MSEIRPNRHQFKWLCLATIALISLAASAQDKHLILNVDGSVKFQTLDGLGVNINPAWWYMGEYGEANTIKPAIDLLIDSLRASIYRVVIEEIDWESVNDDSDPAHFNWDYYNPVFTNKKFRCIWDVLRYLNYRGITKNLMISFMGAAPAPEPVTSKDTSKYWMGGTDYTIRPDMEEELAESITAFLYYARNIAGISFTLVSPLNETDIVGGTKSPEHPDGIVEGPNIPDPAQYARIIRKLAQRLDASGMGDIRFVAPDAAGEKLFAGIVAEMVKDPYLMGKLQYWGVHQYGNDAEHYRKIVERQGIPSKPFWVTETAGIGHMLGQLDDNAAAYIFWDGFDCVYQHGRRNGYGDAPPNDWAFWMKPEDGQPLIEYIPETGGWKPRKQFYQHLQLMKFIKPDAVRIDLKGADSTLLASAFLNINGELIIVGQNLNDRTLDLKIELKNLSGPECAKLFLTTAVQNISESDQIKLSEGTLTANIPPASVFTIVLRKDNNPATLKQ